VEYIYEDKVVKKVFDGNDAMVLLQRARDFEQYKHAETINYKFLGEFEDGNK